MSFFTIGVLALGIAVLINIIFKRIDIPVIIGYIVTGVIIVYAFDLHELSASKDLNKIAEFGIVFLMFMIGLEFSFARIKSIKQEVLTFGGLQVVLTSGIFFYLCYFLCGMDIKNSAIVACAFSLSSTAIVLKSFEESKVMGRGYAKSALGILIMQDIAVIPILLMVAMFSSGDANLGAMVFKTIISAIVVLFILFVPGKFLATRILKFSADTHMDEIFVGTVLFIVLGAALLSEYFGFSHSLGAFIAGMVISSSEYKYQVEADLAHFRDIFLGLFFVTVGMQVDLAFLLANFFLIGVSLLFVMLVKVGVIFGILRVFKKSVKLSLKTALSLCQIGEFSFAVFLLAQTNGIITVNGDGRLFEWLVKIGMMQRDFSVQDLHQMLTLMVILSMIATPFILKNLRKIVEFLLPKEASQEVLACEIAYVTRTENKLTHHVVVCGYGTFGQATIEFLKQRDLPYIAVDYNLSRVEEGIAKGNRVIFGNVVQKSILESLNIEESLAVIVAVDHTSHIKNICDVILGHYPNCKIVAKVASEVEEEELMELNLVSVINEKKEIAKILANLAVSKGR